MSDITENIAIATYNPKCRIIMEQTFASYKVNLIFSENDNNQNICFNETDEISVFLLEAEYNDYKWEHLANKIKEIDKWKNIPIILFSHVKDSLEENFFFAG